MQIQESAPAEVLTARASMLELREEAMKEQWSNCWVWQLTLTAASMIVLMALAIAVSDAIAGHAVSAKAEMDWKAQLAKVDEAAGKNEVALAVLRWAEAYAAALRTRHWEGLVAVADVYRRIGELGGFREAAEAKAREIYLAALFRAGQEASLDGVLSVAEAFADLGDADVVERCLKVARPLAKQTRDSRADQLVGAFAERWRARRLEVEQQNGLGGGGSVR